MKTGLFLLTLVLASSALAKVKPKPLVRKPNSELSATFKFSYDRSVPSLSFEDASGSPIGKYNSEFQLRMDDEMGYLAVDKFKDTEILITQWPNGAATYNVRVFVPVSKNAEIKAQSEPVCDISEKGDTQDLSQNQLPLTRVTTRTMNGQKKSFLQVKTNKAYVDCVELRKP